MDGFGSDSGSMSIQPEGLSKSDKVSDPEFCKSVVSDENREYTPVEVLDWETQIYTEEDLAKLENDQMLDENEEKKSKSTLDSTEKTGLLIEKDKGVKGITSKEAWTMPILINVDRFENPIADNVLICDMYIKVKTGGSRTLDKVYSQSKLYFKYLRYGLTFLEFYNPDDPEVCEKVELVRKGLMRVFELKIDYLLQELDSLSVKGKIMAQKDWNIRNYIVGDAYSYLDSEPHPDDDPDSESKIGDMNHVELCHYVQTDGINVQISWCSSLKCWSIGSYSVSILAATVEDLKKYPGYNK